MFHKVDSIINLFVLIVFRVVIMFQSSMATLSITSIASERWWTCFSPAGQLDAFPYHFIVTQAGPNLLVWMKLLILALLSKS